MILMNFLVVGIYFLLNHVSFLYFVNNITDCQLLVISLNFDIREHNETGLLGILCYIRFQQQFYNYIVKDSLNF